MRESKTIGPRMIQFFNDGRDERGLPEPFHVYQIYATSPGPSGLSAVATIVAVDGSPPEHIPLVEGDCDRAMEEARQYLIEKHEGLKRIG